MISNNEFKAIAELDLDPIKVKLMHKESGEGWSLEQASMVEFEYRRFLYLMKKFPNEQTAPLFDVDIFWHYHILDTMKYAVDCDEVFGYFLHHFPYIGLRGEEDEAAHERVGARMQELYEETFGEPMLRGARGAAVPAWSSTVTQEAGHAAQMQTAWSSTVTQEAARTAWSSSVTQEAGRTAWSSSVTQEAGKMAWSSSVTQEAGPAAALTTAWSSATVAAAYPALAGQTAWSSVVAKDSMPAPGQLVAARAAARFYSVRPTLAA